LRDYFSKIFRNIIIKIKEQMNRSILIDEIRKNPDNKWDVIIIGGGATGLGIALDAVTRGFRTLLLEQSDFAKATSSRSTKLVHGGVRYMAQGDLWLVMEACHERGILLKNAPHLTFNQEFVIPVYTWFDAFLYTAGLKFYDLLAGRLSLGKSYFTGAANTVKRLPLLKSKGLKGGIVYHDGQFDDSRLAIELARMTVGKGGKAINYFRVSGMMKDSNGNIDGVTAEDAITGEKFTIKAGLVINATGVFADSIARMDNPGAEPSLRPSQGVHLVLDKSFLGGDSAIMIPKTDDGRVLFAIPWYGKVVVGTTDTPLDEISLEPSALQKEIDFILATAGRYLVRPPEKKDVLCVFAGLRPLAASKEGKSSTKEVSRRHKITLSPSKLLSIVGGKWTTYRRMAEETLDFASRKKLLPERKCVTRNMPLVSGADVPDPALRIYGDQAAGIKSMIALNPEWGELMDPRLPYTVAEMRWICRNEMVVNLEDLLARRTRSLLLDARASLDIAGRAASVMAEELGHSNGWQESQVAKYAQLVKNYIL
jgi:glycerol-3-phosphate dehydrogenase